MAIGDSCVLGAHRNLEHCCRVDVTRPDARSVGCHSKAVWKLAKRSDDNNSLGTADRAVLPHTADFNAIRSFYVSGPAGRLPAFVSGMLG